MKFIETAPFHLTDEELKLQVELIDNHKIGKIGAKQSTEITDNGTFTEENKNYQIISMINFAITPVSQNAVKLVLPNLRNKRKVLLPYQFSGIITAPGDIPDGIKKSFWDRLFEAFIKFILFPISTLIKTWQSFVEAVIGDGSPKHISKAWIANSDLWNKKNELNPKLNPLIPSDVIPRFPYQGLKKLDYGSAGLGIFTSCSYQTGYMQFIDPQNIISQTNNNLNPDSCKGWFLPETTDELTLIWLSNDYETNDGALIGSFYVLEEY